MHFFKELTSLGDGSHGGGGADVGIVLSVNHMETGLVVLLDFEQFLVHHDVSELDSTFKSLIGFDELIL